MVKLILFLLSLIAISTGVYWLSENSGSLHFSLLGYQIETTVTYAAMALICGILLLQCFFLVVYRITNIPKFFADKRKDSLIELLSELVIAVKIDDQENIQKVSKKLLRLKVTERLNSILLLIRNNKTKNEIVNITQLTNLIKYDDIKLGVQRKLIESYLESRNWQIAENYCQELWQIEKTDWVLTAYIKAYIGSEKWQDMLNFLESIGRMNLLNHKLIKVFVGVAEFKVAYKNFYAENYSQAEELIEKAYNALPGFLPAAHLFIEILLKRKKYYEAIDIMQEQWRYAPHPAFTKLAIMLADFFNAEEYLALIKKVVDDNQEHYESHLLLTEAAINIDQFDFASKQLSKALDYHNNSKACLLMLKFCLRTHGSSSEALDWLKRAIKSENNLQEKHYYWDFDKMSWSTLPTNNGAYIASL